MNTNQQALFHDGTEDFCAVRKTESGYTYTLRLRTAADSVKNAWLIIGKSKRRMSFEYRDRQFDFYIYRLRITEGRTVCYSFEVETSDGNTLFYDAAGGYEGVSGKFEFELTAGFDTPEWAKGAVMYQIFPDRFYNGDPSNDVKTDEYAYIGKGVEKVDDWYRLPKEDDVREFYGGDLKGVLDKLDYLEKLGVEVIYLNPVFVSPSNHKYDVQDYDFIDPHLGVIVKDDGRILKPGENSNKNARMYITRTTAPENLNASNRFFAGLVEEIHRRNMKIILDGVFNHCGSFNKWMNREKLYRQNDGYKPGAYERGDSPYHGFFKFSENSWPDNSSYEGWWDFDTLPKLNYEQSEKLCRYIIRTGVKWVSPPYNADGWRLDVAADLGHGAEFNHKFWKRFRAAVKAANPDAVILAEHYGSAKEWLRGDEWDTVMNYDAFMDPVSWFLTGVDKHSDTVREELKGDADAFMKSMTVSMAGFQTPSLLCAMNELSNHDHSRFLTRTNGKAGRIGTEGSAAAGEGVDKAVMKMAVVMQMTLPGAPAVYYGDEAGLCGWTDPDCRRTYPWGREDMELLEFHRDMICIHKRNPALRRGSYKPVLWERDVFAYGRFAGDNILAVALNTSPEEKTLELPVWQLGIDREERMDRLMLTGRELYNAGRVSYAVRDGMLIATLPGLSAAVFKNRRKATDSR